jgi:glycosyltransferase involved in cell wall biosynthesis
MVGAGKQVIWLIGPFPPPLHGQAVYNAAFAAHLRARGELRVLATGEGVGSKLAATLRILSAVLVRMRRRDIVYTSMPGQMGAWLFALVVAALRLRGLRHFVHHHSFRAIVLGPGGVMRLVVALGGKAQHHILLSDAMRDRFADLYLRADPSRAHALSNALLFCPAIAQVPARPPRPATIGHLSVLTRDKGVDAVIALFRTLAVDQPMLRLILAGPVADAALREEIERAVADFPGRVDYRGAVAGEAKRDFFRNIDLFLLPTRLIDEAEPLVMMESYAAGVEFMGTARGCIPERLRRPDAVLTGDAQQDAARVRTVLNEGERDWAGLRQACGHHAEQLHAAGAAEAQALFGHMLPSDRAVIAEREATGAIPPR